MTEMIKITLPDGSVRDVAAGTTPAQIAADIGPGLAKAALAARVDGELRDIMRPLERNAQLALVTARDEADALELARHDFAHVLAEAVQSLYPGTQITFGPATEDGFYYDFAPSEQRGPFTDEDLPAIEAEMRRIIAADKPLQREVWERDDLIARWRDNGETFKAEWAAELPEDEEITVYWSGDKTAADAWLDMCKGPHMASTGKLDPKAFKLTRVSGAYWRGDQNNPQLSRIYGTGWLNRKQLANTCCASKKRPNAITANWVRKWTCSTFSPRRRAACSGMPRAISCGASLRPICAASSMPRAMTRSRHRS